MTRDTNQSDQRRRWIRRLLAGPAILLGIAVATIACMVPVTAVLMAFDGLGVRAAWLTPVVMFPFLIPFYYIAAKTSVWLSSILERITGTEDDLTAFLRQVTYVETGPEDGHWIDRGGRIYEDEAALMRGVKRFAKERDS
jgi:hypothetical protein